MKAIAVTLKKPIVRSLGATTIFAALTAVLAQAAIRVPYTPVPITMQVLGVILSGLVLGSRLGALAQIQYLAVGLAGVPVFAGASFGPMALLGPSGGYLPGFVVGAYITGLLFERSVTQDKVSAIVSGMAGVAGIYACGVAWLSVWVNMFGTAWPGASAWLLGVLPFIAIDAVKVTAASIIVTGSSRWRK